jgi:hypothetical protein
MKNGLIQIKHSQKASIDFIKKKKRKKEKKTLYFGGILLFS